MPAGHAWSRVEPPTAKSESDCGSRFGGKKRQEPGRLRSTSLDGDRGRHPRTAALRCCGRATAEALGFASALSSIAFMAYDEELADRIRELLGDEANVTEQKMFGGLAFLVRGNMAVAASGQGGVLVRVDPAGCGQTDRERFSTAYGNAGPSNPQPAAS